jgi:hypothetical protein
MSTVGYVLTRQKDNACDVSSPAFGMPCEEVVGDKKPAGAPKGGCFVAVHEDFTSPCWLWRCMPAFALVCGQTATDWPSTTMALPPLPGGAGFDHVLRLKCGTAMQAGVIACVCDVDSLILLYIDPCSRCWLLLLQHVLCSSASFPTASTAPGDSPALPDKQAPRR